MPDGTVHTPDVDEVVEFTIRVACECYCCSDLVLEALSTQPSMNGALFWESPRQPGSPELASDVDLVLIVADKNSLQSALERSAKYRRAGRQHPSPLLIYLQGEEEDFPDGTVSGLTLPYSQLAEGLNGLIRTVFEPVIPHGLVCVDWADTRHVLDMDGQVVIEDGSGTRLEDAVESVMEKLRHRAAGRLVHGMQVSIFCAPSKLAVRKVPQVLVACKETTDEDSTIILAAPFVDRSESDGYEVRLFARVKCR